MYVCVHALHPHEDKEKNEMEWCVCMHPCMYGSRLYKCMGCIPFLAFTNFTKASTVNGGKDAVLS